MVDASRIVLAITTVITLVTAVGVTVNREVERERGKQSIRKEFGEKQVASSK